MRMHFGNVMMRGENAGYLLYGQEEHGTGIQNC